MKKSMQRRHVDGNQKTSKGSFPTDPRNSTSQRKKLGILGGGQLARMLAESAHRLGIEIHILSENASDPAAQVARNWHQGSPHSLSDLAEFFRKVDLVTFESEFIDAGKIREALRKAKTPDLPFFPKLELIEKLQDRRDQKNLLVAAGLPTSVHLHSTARDEHLEFFNQHKKVVYKKRRGGYDGYGTFIVKSSKELETFLAAQNLSDFIVEKFIPFKRELAIVFARNAEGKITSMPLVETFQTQSRCDWVMGPLEHKGLGKLEKRIRTWLGKLDYVGVIAFELFESAKGELMVNEIAPRVHNSAHYSQDALTFSQFDLHLFSGLGFGLPRDLQLRGKSFVMLNLLGTEPSCLIRASLISGSLHWYGKLDSRPGRKMGHLNYISQVSGASLLKIANKERLLYFPHQLEKEKSS